eukprot:scaffold7995_cov173-Amphora_coffeaeformis.AAC.8
MAKEFGAFSAFDSMAREILHLTLSRAIPRYGGIAHNDSPSGNVRSGQSAAISRTVASSLQQGVRGETTLNILLASILPA